MEVEDADATEQWSQAVSPVVGSEGDAYHGVFRHRPALVEEPRWTEQVAPVRNCLGAADQPGAVQDNAERPLLIVLDEQDHGPVKVGIRQQGSGDEQLRPE